MKRFVACILALALLFSLMTTAFAEKPRVMYVNKDKLEAYKEPNRDSKVVKKLKGGTKVTLSPEMFVGSEFVNILIENTKHGGQMGGLRAGQVPVRHHAPEIMQAQVGQVEDHRGTHLHREGRAQAHL